jgi:hypothetical protein
MFISCLTPNDTRFFGSAAMRKSRVELAKSAGSNKADSPGPPPMHLCMQALDEAGQYITKLLN